MKSGSVKAGPFLKVESYSGYKGEERPLRFTVGERTYQVQAVLDQWYGPQAVYFRVRADDGNLYILRRSHGDEQECWTLEAFRRLKPGETP